MFVFDVQNAEEIKDRLRKQAETNLFRVTAHAHQEMMEENISSLELAIIITVYEPKAPKWINPFKRGGRE